jgi:ubiquinone/menaquinone biosynthesis C-methylase UbiE
VSARLIALDLFPAPGVDIVGDAHEIPLASDSVDCVLGVSMLMHCREPHRVISEAYRVLKPGGLMYMSTPFILRYAPDPIDYVRYSVEGLRSLCASFEEIQCDYNRGPASTVADILSHFAAITLCFNSRRVYGVLVDVFQWGFFSIKYFDRWISRYQVAHVLHNAPFFFGRKPIRLPTERAQADALGR